MTATANPSAPRQCDVCKVNLSIDRKGEYAAIYVCPKCGVAVIDDDYDPDEESAN